MRAVDYNAEARAETAARRAAVAQLMRDGRPRTVADVALRLGMARGQARSALHALAREGVLAASSINHVTLFETVGDAR